MKRPKYIIALVLSLVIFGMGTFMTNTFQPVKNSPHPEIAGIEGEMAKVVSVVDGDTIKVLIGQKQYTVRFIGMNTPETVDPRKPVECFGKEASNENKELLTGKQVILQKDVSETDKFGRLLRFVYLPLDNGKMLFVNDYLVREGFAEIDTIAPDVKLADQFKSAQTQAKQNHLGMWSKCL